jgi:hypothetical protein
MTGAATPVPGGDTRPVPEPGPALLPVCSCCRQRVLRPIGTGLACPDCDRRPAPAEPPPGTLGGGYSRGHE